MMTMPTPSTTPTITMIKGHENKISINFVTIDAVVTNSVDRNADVFICYSVINGNEMKCEEKIHNNT